MAGYEGKDQDEPRVKGIHICKMPYQEHPYVHGIREGRDVWLKDDGSWTEDESSLHCSIPLGGPLVVGKDWTAEKQEE